MSKHLGGKENGKNYVVEDEMTLKDIILKMNIWWRTIWFQRLRIISLSLLLGLLTSFYISFYTTPFYTASYELFFEDESNGMTGAMRLASSVGLVGLGSGSSSSSSKVQEYITSRSNIATAITSDLHNGRLIDRYYAGAFEDDEHFSSEFELMFGSNRRYTDSTITFLFHILNKENLSSVFDEKKGTLSLTAVASEESFALDLVNTLIESTEEQFKKWDLERSNSAVKAFQKKVDSLELSIDQALLLLGQYEDQNNSLVSSVDRMKRLRLTIDLESLKVAYGEYIKGLEMSKVELISHDPPFKYFDAPTYPLYKEEGSPAKSGIIASVIAIFILVLFFVIRAEFFKIMEDQ